jgi:hypothetical protein
MKEDERIHKEFRRLDRDIQKSFEKVFRSSRKTLDFLADK